MTIDSVLNLLGLIISLGGLVAAGLRRQTILAIIAFALVITTGTTLWLQQQHEREISRVKNEINAKLSFHRWTADQILSEVRPGLKYQDVNEALFRAVDNQEIHEELTECVESTTGSVLSTRVFYH